MITVKLMGGLGNQMFQAAYAKALEARGYAVQLNRSNLAAGTHREYSLGYFGIEAVPENEGSRVYENGMRFNSDYLTPTDGSTMVGYWQSEKYFESIAEKIREKFKFQDFGPDLNVIAVHVRRQDYVELQEFHGLLSVDYYQEAVAYIRRKTGLNLPVHVFSDDHRWCVENLPPDFTVMNGGNKYEDLKLMQACDYHVIANSSYSWWGAWLSRDRITVAPKQWFTSPEMDAADIVPKRWVTL